MAEDLGQNRAYPACHVYVRLNIGGDGRQWVPANMEILKLPYKSSGIVEFNSMEMDHWLSPSGEPYKDD